MPALQQASTEVGRALAARTLIPIRPRNGRPRAEDARTVRYDRRQFVILQRANYLDGSAGLVPEGAPVRFGNGACGS